MTPISSFLKSFDFNDRHLAYTFFISSLLFIIFNQIYLQKDFFFEIGIAIFSGSLIYILFRERFSDDIGKLELNASSLHIKILNSAFFFIIAIIGCLFQLNIYRPQEYYLLIVICSGLLALDVLMVKTKRYCLWILVKIFFLALLLRMNLFYEFPGFYGVDPWTHMRYVQFWYHAGHITNELGAIAYAGYPLFHIEVIITKLISGMDIKDSFYLSIGLVYVFGIIFLFLFVRTIFYYKVALLSSLFLAINQFHIAWGAWIIPTSLGVLMLIMFLYIVHSKMRQISGGVIIVLSILMLVYMHTLSPLIIFISLSIYFLFCIIYSKISGENSLSLYNKKFVFLIISVIGVATISRYMFESFNFNSTFLESVIDPLANTIDTDLGFSGEIATVTISDYPLNRVSLLLIIAFTLIGALFVFKDHIKGKERIAIIFTLISLFAFAYVPALINIDNFLPGRWTIFAMIFVAPICALGIYKLSLIPNLKIIQMFIIVLIVMLLAFFSVNNQSVNPRTPFYSQLSEDPARSAYTQGELSAAETLYSIHVGALEMTGPRYATVFQYIEGRNTGYNSQNMVIGYNSQNMIRGRDTLVITRLYDLSHVMTKTGIQNLRRIKEQENFIYNDGSVWANIKNFK